jgi:hypothetical protein
MACSLILFIASFVIWIDGKMELGLYWKQSKAWHKGWDDGENK